MRYKFIGKIVCEKCKQEFPESTIDVEVAKVELNNVIVDLVYFTCPKCEKIHRVSIQDARYYDLKEDLEKAKKRMRRNHGKNNQEMARVLYNMVVKKHERLKAHVDKVNEIFSGTFTFDVSENNPKEKIIKYLP